MTVATPFPVAAEPLQLPGLVLVVGSHCLDESGLPPLLDALPAGPQRGSVNLPGAALAVAEGDSHLVDNIGVVCIGRPYWRNRDCQATADRDGIAASIAQAYRKFGDAFIERLAGEFSLALCDTQTGRITCAVDRFGRYPLYWHGDAAGLVVGTTADAVLAHPALERRLSNQGLFHYLFFHMVPGPDSVFERVHKLHAAHRLTWSATAPPQVAAYWLPEFREETTDRQALEKGVLDTLDVAVARYDTGEDTGSFLSGGLDSSTVTGLLAKRRPAADSYSIGFDAHGYDEIAYARIAAGHFGSQGHEYYVRPEDVVSALPAVAAAYDEPFGNSSALPALFCASLARSDGKQRLLAGDGGDELYAGNVRYSKQQVFEVYQQLPPALQGLLHGAASLIPEQAPVIRKLKSYVNQAEITLPTRLQSYNYLYRLGLEGMLEPDFANSVDPDQPDRIDRVLFERPPEASTLNRMLYLDWQHTLADNDLRKVGRMCALAGIEVNYPMLDDEVVEHSTRVPSRMKLPMGRLRHFYKQAVSDFLPTRIINKPKQGFGLPFGIWLAEDKALHEMAADNLLRLRRRRIVQPAFIDRLMQLHQNSHAAYYGEYVWVLMMLEMWLSSRGFEP